MPCFDRIVGTCSIFCFVFKLYEGKVPVATRTLPADVFFAVYLNERTNNAQHEGAARSGSQARESVCGERCSIGGRGVRTPLTFRFSSYYLTSVCLSSVFRFIILAMVSGVYGKGGEGGFEW